MQYQAMPDWRGGNTKKRGRLTDEAKKGVTGRMLAFFGKKAQTKVRGQPNPKQRRLANKYSMMAADDAIRSSTGLTGLREFQVRRPVRPLRAGEALYHVSMDSLPEDLQRRAQGRTRRCCLQSLGEQPRLYVNWHGPRPVLLTVLDMGSIGWVSKGFLFSNSGGKLRGFYDVDPCHRRYDNVLHSLQESGLSWAKTEVVVAQCMSSAPWGGAAFFHSLKDAAKELRETFGVASELFQVFYPRIAFEMSGGRIPVSFGSREHAKEVFDAAFAAPPLHRKGTKTKSGRWFQPWEKEKDSMGFWAVQAMVLLYIGLTAGWASAPSDAGAESSSARPTSASASPSTVGTPALPPPSSARGGAQPRIQVAHSNKEAAKLRDSAANYQHLTYMIRNNYVLHSLWCLIDRITEPIKAEHSRTIVIHKTRKGTRRPCGHRVKFWGHFSLPKRFWAAYGGLFLGLGFRV